ncbi:MULTISPECIES: hypothetical protein [unclassified Streptomyces]|uniref:hypothetical protein n=1 Tax=unclassified Streptomyces TaxID=2593676 RepID=UPI003D89B47A
MPSDPYQVIAALVRAEAAQSRPAPTAPARQVRSAPPEPVPAGSRPAAVPALLRWIRRSTSA